MSLDLVNGELLADLGPHFRVVPASKWTDTPFWQAAHEEARAVFKRTAKEQRIKQKRAIIEPAYFQPEATLCQEYPTQGRIAFVFQAKLGTKVMYHDVRIAFPRDAENQLILMGRWKRETVQ